MSKYHGGVKKDKTDTAFSNLVRWRANWKCERCGEDWIHDQGRLHCSHVFGRRHKSVRWHPDNAHAHCYKCHDEFTKDPMLHAEWVMAQIGQSKYETLKLRAMAPYKFCAYEKELLHKHYLQEIKRMRAIRATGSNERIEFTVTDGYS